MKAIRKFFGFVFLIIIAAAAIVCWTGYSKYASALKEKPLDAAVSEIKSIKNYTSLDDIPQMYTDSVIAAEDRRFYYHNGFDIIGTARAIMTDIKEKKLAEGGSTITQQLAKNMYFIKDNSPTRKIAEIFMALRIEREYSKNEILELYVNGIYYGSGYYCLYDASEGYFGKPPADMTDYESTLLAGIPNAPSAYSLKVNPELAEKRQNKIISALVDCGYITDEQGKDILNEKDGKKQ